MSEGGAAAFQFGRAGASESSVGTGELREALGLVQESMIKLLRFQLAMERRDRRVALETIDDVVVLERRLDALVNQLPPLADGAAQSALRLGEQRQKLAREKFTLAAGMTGPAAAERPGWTEPADILELEHPLPPAVEPACGAETAADLLAARYSAEPLEDSESDRRRRPRRRVIALTASLLLLAGAAAYGVAADGGKAARQLYEQLVGGIAQ